VDELAYSLTFEVNSLHSSGYALDGATTGLDFFADLSGLVSPPAGAAQQMSISSNIIDQSSIATASSPASPGDNTLALAMSDLQSLKFMSGGTVTTGDFYNGLVADIGGELNSARSRLSHQEGMIRQLEMRRESVSGVSLDEEMTDLVRFQHAYEASARLISIADEMLETVIDLVR
jgi:flagellar hook-associated protein 1 FlgK